jgi:hypothetical protein
MACNQAHAPCRATVLCWLPPAGPNEAREPTCGGKREPYDCAYFEPVPMSHAAGALMTFMAVCNCALRLHSVGRAVMDIRGSRSTVRPAAQRGEQGQLGQVAKTVRVGMHPRHGSEADNRTAGRGSMHQCACYT